MNTLKPSLLHGLVMIAVAGCAHPFLAKDFYSMGAFWSDLKQWGIYTTYSYTPNPDPWSYSP